jgi:hypothetical protein
MIPNETCVRAARAGLDSRLTLLGSLTSPERSTLLVPRPMTPRLAKPGLAQRARTPGSDPPRGRPGPRSCEARGRCSGRVPVGVPPPFHPRPGPNQGDNGLLRGGTHNPQNSSSITAAREMGLHGMAQALDTQRTQPDVQGLAFEDGRSLLAAWAPDDRTPSRRPAGGARA